MPLATLSAQITSAGISAPSYAEIFQSLIESAQAIYGSDVYLAPDSQDGQMLALVAKAINDANNAAIAVYNSFSPTYAQGAGLSSVVKINNLQRLAASFSTATGTIVGVAGTDIANGVVQDTNSNKWDLPAVITIPNEGSVDVTVTAQQPGGIGAPTGTINQIVTPIRGWQSFVSITDAVPGAPVESDATLRRRQSVSQPLSAITPVAAIYAALANLSGVQRLQVYENPTGAPDSNGLPAHSISAVIEGGTLTDIAETIALKKTPGAATYGTTTQNYTDPVTGLVTPINFFLLADTNIKVRLSIRPRAGYASTVLVRIEDTIAAYLNGLDIGEDVLFTRLYPPSMLNGAAAALTYEVVSLEVAIVGNAFGVIDIPINFNKAAACDTANIDITVL